jgi:hypothetical protein
MILLKSTRLIPPQDLKSLETNVLEACQDESAENTDGLELSTDLGIGSISINSPPTSL